MQCVCCGTLLGVAVVRRYCSVGCAEDQLRAVGTLLHSTPRSVLSVEEWHDLSADYATELELLGRVEGRGVQSQGSCGPRAGHPVTHRPMPGTRVPHFRQFCAACGADWPCAGAA